MEALEDDSCTAALAWSITDGRRHRVTAASVRCETGD
jgi:hypothetical protein